MLLMETIIYCPLVCPRFLRYVISTPFGGILKTPQVPMFWERSAAIMVSCLHRTNHNTNLDTIFNKKSLFELSNILQQAIPTAPLIVFFHYNNVINNTNSNSAVDSVFVQKLNEIMRELIIKSSFPLRKLLVQPYNLRSNFGFSDGLWWLASNVAPLPMSVEQLQLSWHATATAATQNNNNGAGSSSSSSSIPGLL